MTNDTNTLNGALQELGETMAENLVSMGVTDADASDGLTTLAGKILTIEPSIGGLDLDTAITLSSSSASITLGQSIILTSTLTASYDDETLVNVDLEGFLTGATVSFMNGNAVIGTDVTDSNGVATYTYTPAASGTLSLKAVFAGTDNFDDCESSAVTVSVIAVPDSISLSADKSVLSYYDSESATLSATVLDANSQPCSGETVEFFNGSTSMGTATTNDSGVATKSYSSTGVGDVSFTAEVGSLVSGTYVLTDAVYAHASEISQSGASGDHFTVIDNNLSLTMPNKFEWSFKMKSNNAGSRFIMAPVSNKSSSNPNYSIGVQQTSTSRVGLYRTSSVTAVGSDASITGTDYHEWKITRDGNTFKWYFDGTQVNSDITLTWFDTYTPKTLGFMYWKTGTMNVKDIVIKAL